MNDTIAQNKVDNPLATEPIPRLILKYSVPTAFTLMVTYLYNIVDQIFVGQGVGIGGMAATNIAFPLVILVNAVALLLGDGCAANMSLHLGRRKQEKADAVISQAFTLIVGGGILLAILTWILAPKIVYWFGATDSVYAESLAYMRTIAWGIPFQLVCPAFAAIIRADGAPSYTLKCMIVGSVVNLILDPIFIFLLHMGVVGAGIATVIGQILSAVLCLMYLRNLKIVRLRKEFLRPTASVTGSILTLGFPSFVTQISFALVQITMNNLMRAYGEATIYGSDIALGVYGMMMKVYQLCHSMLVGVSSAVQPINGYNFGARSYERVRKTYVLAGLIAIIISTVWFAIFMIFPRQLAMMFVLDNELYWACAAHCFRLYMMAFLFYGLHMTTASFFQSIGRPLKSLLIPIVRQWIILMPLAVILAKFFGMDGALLAAPISDVFVFILSLVLVKAEFVGWRKNNWLPQK